MVVEVGVRDGHPVRRMRQVHQPVVEVLVPVPRRREVAVVDPDVLGELDRDGIAVVGLDLGDLHVAHDDVLLSEDGEADALECCSV